MPVETWDRTRQVNLDGAFYIVQGEPHYTTVQLDNKTDTMLQLQPNRWKGRRRKEALSSLFHRSRHSSAVLCNGAHLSPTLYDSSQSISSHYTPTKAGVLSLMQSCAVALGKYNIRANAVLPGTIATAINEADLADPVKRSYTVSRTALGRLGGEMQHTK